MRPFRRAIRTVSPANIYSNWDVRASTKDEQDQRMLKLEDINEGFALMKRGESIRSVVEF